MPLPEGAHGYDPDAHRSRADLFHKACVVVPEERRILYRIERLVFSG